MYRRGNHGNCTLAFATKPIAEGEEIADTYCATFASAPIEKRRDALRDSAWSTHPKSGFVI